MGTAESRTRVATSEREQVRREAMAIALAAIERLGCDSPARLLSSDRFLLRDFVFDILRRGPTKLFMCGGFNGNSLKSVHIFDVVQNEWQHGPEMSTPRNGHACALLGGRIFAISGDAASSTVATVEAFEIEKASWAPMPPLNTGRYRPGVGVVGEKIFIVGGRAGSKHIDTCEVFDSAKGKWLTTVAPMPTARYDMGIAVIGPHIFAFGGYDIRGGYLATAEVLDTETNTWMTLPPMPTARMGLAVAVIDNRFIWTFGGTILSALHNVVEIFDAEKCRWVSCETKLPGPLRHGAKAVAIDHKIYILGGRRNDFYDDMDILDTDTMTWTHATLPTAVVWTGLACF